MYLHMLMVFNIAVKKFGIDFKNGYVIKLLPHPKSYAKDYIYKK